MATVALSPVILAVRYKTIFLPRSTKPYINKVGPHPDWQAELE